MGFSSLSQMEHKATKQRQKQEIVFQRFFGGMPVVEAKENLRVFLDPLDIKGSNEKDPAHCAYANACKRLFGSTAVLFLRTIAYVDLPNEKGEREVNRFILSPSVRKQIEKFDRTGTADPAGYILRRPDPSSRLDYKKQYVKKLRKRHQKARKASLLGKSVPQPVGKSNTQGKKLGYKAKGALLTDVRNGTGMVHFIEN